MVDTYVVCSDSITDMVLKVNPEISLNTNNDSIDENTQYQWNLYINDVENTSVTKDKDTLTIPAELLDYDDQFKYKVTLTL